MLSTSLLRYTGHQSIRGNTILTRGRSFWDVHIDRSHAGQISLGVCIDAQSANQYIGQSNAGYAYNGSSGKKAFSGVAQEYGPKFGQGDTIRIMVDMDDRTISFCKNGETLGIAFFGIPSKLFPAFSLYHANDLITLRKFGTY
eukprot:CAMPEP_0167744888 /NCGR_PEP_ID=MMETSP0110_2-20121227/2842_1 /TAXON_ID=629695 /ORGANISM="Gymnochlora sp., Strain CCMP2014" /LENGTH=142 /DNA_ID=CAMNT_0007629461 /DNA_START=482 /DNA_END=910 /DNA_ORIENTATION=+